MGTGSFPEVKRPRRGVHHPLPSSAEVKERVELYLYFKGFLVHPKTACKGKNCISSLILNLGIRWEWRSSRPGRLDPATVNKVHTEPGGRAKAYICTPTWRARRDDWQLEWFSCQYFCVPPVSFTPSMLRTKCIRYHTSPYNLSTWQGRWITQKLHAHRPVTVYLLHIHSGYRRKDNENTTISFFPIAQTARSGRWSPQYRGFTITLRHTTLGRTPPDKWSAWCSNLYPTTHSAYRHPCSRRDSTRNSIKRAAADPRRRPRGHRDQHHNNYRC